MEQDNKTACRNALKEAFGACLKEINNNFKKHTATDIIN